MYKRQYIYAKKITTPIKEICNVTKEMEKLNKRAFCNVESEDEIGILAYNINSLYENLLNTIISLEEEIKNVSESEKVKVDFLRSASHELKTPLMSMHIMIENMLYDIGKYKNHYVYLEKCKDIVKMCIRDSFKTEDKTSSNSGIYENPELTTPASSDGIKISKISANSQDVLTLQGEAGKNSNIDTAISNTFTLILKIKKSTN